MQINTKSLEKSQIEISVELSVEEFTPYIDQGAKKIAEKIKIEGFRPGKAPLEIVKQKVGEMSILEEAAQIAIIKTVDEIVEKEIKDSQVVGQPSVSISKLAPANPLEYKVVLSIMPVVTLGKYKDLNLKIEEVKIDDKDLKRALKDLQEMRATEKIVAREIKEGDKVLSDIHLKLDKVVIEDGHYHDLAVIIGKEYFVPGFDKNLLGAKKGDLKNFFLEYPKDYHQQHLAGKKVEFEVKIKEIYQRDLPKDDDELAKGFGLKNVEELKSSLKDSLLSEKQRNLDLKNESELISKIVESTKFGDFPEVIVENEANNLMLELEQSIMRQGGKFEDYLNHLKKSKEELKLEMMPNVIKRVKSALVIREVSFLEKITATEDEIDQKLESLKEEYKNNSEVVKMLEESSYRNYLQNILTNEKTINQLKEWNYANTGSQQKG